MLMMLPFMMAISLPMILSILIMMMSKKTKTDLQKTTPFECGFNPMSYSRTPFSMHFFLIAVLFLIFDIEIIIIMPMIMAKKTTMIYYWMVTSMQFTIVLIVGLYHEWKNGMLMWTT
nr:NADH dehydrogenase subunit 3 [Acinopterus sp.]